MKKQHAFYKSLLQFRANEKESSASEREAASGGVRHSQKKLFYLSPESPD